MKTIKSKLITIIGIIFLVNLLIGFYVLYQSGKANDLIRKGPSDAIVSIQDSFYMNHLSETIRYEDEVLTQSARNYAYTGNEMWKNRYNEESPKLDLAIKEAIAKGNEIDDSIFEGINNANIALVAMESESMQSVDIGNRFRAQTILDSADYLAQKEIYKLGLDQYHNSKNHNADSIVTESFADLNSINDSIISINTRTGIYTGILITIVILTSTIIYLMVYFFVLKPVLSLKKATNEIANGNLDQILVIKSDDELGALARSFNKMAVGLKESTENIETKIAERTKELEKLNSFMIGREITMIDLKKRIKDLESKDANKN